MDEVYDIGEARSWFLNNSQGCVLCHCGDKELVASSYRKAAEWYESSELPTVRGQ